MLVFTGFEALKPTDFYKINDNKVIIYSADNKTRGEYNPHKALETDDEFFKLWDIFMEFETEIKALERTFTGIFTSLELSVDNMYKIKGCFHYVKQVLEAYEVETVAELIKNKEEEFNFFVSIFWDTDSIINCWKPHDVADVKENVRAVLEKIDGILFHIKDENNI